MNPLTWIQRSAVVGVLVLVTAGVATAAVAFASSNTQPSGTKTEPIPSGKATIAWSPAPPRAGEVVYESLGIRTMPAPADAEPVVPLAAVLASEEVQQYVEGGLAPGEPTTALRLVTTGDFGPTDATPIVAVRGELTWVLDFHHSPLDVHGPVDSANTAPPAADCDLVIMVSATTGDGLSYSQQCPPVASKGARGSARPGMMRG